MSNPVEIPEPAGRLSMADAAGVKIYIGIATHGGSLSVITATSLLALCNTLRANEVDWMVKLHNGEMVARARNKIVEDFLATDCTHLLFVDSDIGFEAKDAVKLVQLNLNVVGALYPLKTYSWDKIADAARAGAGNDELPETGLAYCYNAAGTFVNVRGEKQLAMRSLRGCLAVNEIGGGFMLVRREVFERFAASYPELSYADDYPGNRGNRITTFFDYRIVDDRYLSEDYFFCRKWRHLGGNVWAYPQARLAHAGHHIYAGQFDRRVQSVEKVELNLHELEEHKNG